MKKYLGILGLLAVTIIWGGGFVASDMALETLTPFQIMAVRFFIAAICMTILGGKQLRTIKKDEIKCGFWLGTALFAGFALQIIALQYTTPSKNAFLTATNVVFVPFIALVIYKKKIEMRSLIGAGMAIVGAGVLSLQSDFSVNLGDGLVFVMCGRICISDFPYRRICWKNPCICLELFTDDDSMYFIGNWFGDQWRFSVPSIYEKYACCVVSWYCEHNYLLFAPNCITAVCR